MSDRLPPPAAASMAEAAALLSGNSPNDQPVMGTESQVPTDEPTSYALKEIGDGFLAIFGFSHHALDCVSGETTSRVEQPIVEGQSLVDITDFQRYVIETNGARFSCCNHGTLIVKDPTSRLAFRKLFKPPCELIQLPLPRQCGRLPPGRLLPARPRPKLSLRRAIHSVVAEIHNRIALATHSMCGHR
jgi:hypothetical protein